MVSLEPFDAHVFREKKIDIAYRTLRSCASSGDKNRHGVTGKRIQSKTHSSIGWWCQLEYASEDGISTTVPVLVVTVVYDTCPLPELLWALWALARAADVSSASGKD